MELFARGRHLIREIVVFGDAAVLENNFADVFIFPRGMKAHVHVEFGDEVIGQKKAAGEWYVVSDVSVAEMHRVLVFGADAKEFRRGAVLGDGAVVFYFNELVREAYFESGEEEFLIDDRIMRHVAAPACCVCGVGFESKVSGVEQTGAGNARHIIVNFFMEAGVVDLRGHWGI